MLHPAVTWLVGARSVWLVRTGYDTEECHRGQQPMNSLDHVVIPVELALARYIIGSSHTHTLCPSSLQGLFTFSRGTAPISRVKKVIARPF